MSEYCPACASALAAIRRSAPRLLPNRVLNLESDSPRSEAISCVPLLRVGRHLESARGDASPVVGQIIGKERDGPRSLVNRQTQA